MQFLNRRTRPHATRCAEADSFPVPTYLLLKVDGRLGINDVIAKIAGYVGKGAKSLDFP